MMKLVIILRLPSLNAALGLAQISKINYFLKLKRKLFDRYNIIFNKIEGIKLFKENKYSKKAIIGFKL